MKKLYLLLFAICSLFLISCGKKASYEVLITYSSSKYDVNYTYIETYTEGDKCSLPVIDGINNENIENFTDENGTVVEFPLTVDKDYVITANFKAIKYTYTYYNWDKSQILKQVTAEEGSTIVPPTEDPTKPEDEYHTYEFTNWSNFSDILTADIEITPSFTTIYKKFEVNFYSLGEIIETQQVSYGSYPTEPSIKKFQLTSDKALTFQKWIDKDTGLEYDLNTPISSVVNIEAEWSTKDLIKPTLKNATISMLGDSVSTFYKEGSSVNSYYHGENEFYYPRYCPTVDSVDKTWWYQTITGVGAKIGINNSWSGTTAYGSSNSGNTVARMSTLDENGTPDIVFVFLGINDNVSGNSVDNIRSAFVTIIDYITENYTVETEDTIKIPYIYLITAHYSAYYTAASHGKYSDQKRLLTNKMIFELAEDYDYVNVFDLASVITEENYTKCLADYLHFNTYGHKLFATEFIKKLKEDFE